MNPESESKLFRNLFDQLRREEEQHTPSFSRYWGMASLRLVKRRQFRRHLRLTTGVAAVCVLIVVSVHLTHRLSHPRVESSTLDSHLLVSISTWQSPTDFLLKPPADRLTTIPTSALMNRHNIESMMPFDQNQQPVIQEKL